MLVGVTKLGAVIETHCQYFWLLLLLIMFRKVVQGEGLTYTMQEKPGKIKILKLGDWESEVNLTAWILTPLESSTKYFMCTFPLRFYIIVIEEGHSMGKGICFTLL